MLLTKIFIFGLIRPVIEASRLIAIYISFDRKGLVETIKPQI